MLRDVKGFLGCFSIDELPKKMKKNDSLVINFDKKNMPGSHWVCAVNYLNSVEYFDSYGVAPPKMISDFLKTSGKDIRYNSEQIQSLGSILCGYYCCFYIMKRAMGYEPEDILHHFGDNTIKNEKKIEKIFIKKDIL
jgi:hypothetical protein